MDFIIDHHIILILIAGWLLDLIFGDPIRLPHPVVYFGKWISFWEHRLNKGSHRMVEGAIMSITSILLVFGIILLFILVIEYVLKSLWLSFILQAVLVFFCLAGHTLRKEVRMVFEALDRNLDEGRKQVSRIVGRDTSELSAQEVRTAALETLAENLSDGVIAPLFWFCLLGVPGMMAYKMVNTLDSMIGYQNPRYKDFGCWAAHIDDVANYFPARITAVLIIFVASIYRNGHKTNFFKLFKFVLHYGPLHASPNSGWPESSLAGALDCQFGGSHKYFGENFYKPYIGTNPRNLTTEDMHYSIKICLLAEIFAIIICIWIVCL